MTFGVLLVLPLMTGGAAQPPMAGDAEFSRRDYARAEAIYDSTRRSPDSTQSLWRLARLYVCMGDVAREDAREGLYRKAAEYARRSIVADSSLAPGHTWRAAALGNLAMFEGGKTKVQLCHEIKAELDKAIALDPTDDIAYSITGSFYLALGNVSWIERQLAALFLGSLPPGGFPEAEAALKRAVVLAPGIVRHRYEMGLLYVAMDRELDAREEFHITTTLPSVLASDDHTKQLAQEWFDRLANN